MNEEKTIICRCEDVTLKKLRELIRSGVTDIEELKRYSRCGMGPCQGRTCSSLLLRELAKLTGSSLSEMAPTMKRPPDKPVKLQLLAEEGEDDD